MIPSCLISRDFSLFSDAMTAQKFIRKEPYSSFYNRELEIVIKKTPREHNEKARRGMP
jgi:hypothetical protein